MKVPMTAAAVLVGGIPGQGKSGAARLVLPVVACVCGCSFADCMAGRCGHLCCCPTGVTCGGAR